MAKITGSRSPRSYILEIFIVLLIVVLLLAIMVPRMQWNQQAKERDLARQRMENISFAAKFYNRTLHGYTSNLDELLAFAEQESITVHPPGFKIDRMTRMDDEIDSLQFEYFDPYGLFSHYEEAISIKYPAGEDSLILKIEPKPEFSFAPVTSYYLASDNRIYAENVDRGDQGIFTLVGTKGRLRMQQVLGEQLKVIAADYIYNIDRKNLGVCPTTGQSFILKVNVKLAIEASIKGKLENGYSENSLLRSELLAGNMIYRMVKEADGKAQRVLLKDKVIETIEDSIANIRYKELLDKFAAQLRSEGMENIAAAIYDSTLDNYSIGNEAHIKRWEALRDSSYDFLNRLRDEQSFRTLADSIINSFKIRLTQDNFNEKLEEIRREASISIIEAGMINTTTDSIDYYTTPERIKEELLKPRDDRVTKSYLQRPEVQDLFACFSYEEMYSLSKVDSVGLTIDSPIKGYYKKTDRSLLEKIFTVRGATNPGRVVNGDLSWSEKR